MRKGSVTGIAPRVGLLFAAGILALSCASSADKPSASGNSQLIAANETAAILQVRAIASAESIYMSTAGAGSFGTLTQLVEAGAVSPTLGSGQKGGYRYEVKVAPASYEVTATPVQYAFTGLRSFYMNSTDGVIHSADKKGAAADATDPTL